MSIKPHNQKNFIWNDVKLFTIYSAKSGLLKHSSLNHYHRHYELFMFEKGGGRAIFDGKTVEFGEDTAIIVPPGKNHAIEVAEGQWSCMMSICFNVEPVSDYKKQNGERLWNYFNDLLPKNEVVILKNDFFGNFVHRFVTENEADPELASALIVNLLQNLFLSILRVLNSTADKTGSVSINSYKSSAISNNVVISKTIDDYINKPGCTLTGLAERLNMCPRNTQKVLKKIYGMSFTEKVAEERLTRAQALLKDPKLTLAEVAQLSNYNQYPSFRKAFLARYGISPSAYRKQIKNEV